MAAAAGSAGQTGAPARSGYPGLRGRHPSSRCSTIELLTEPRAGSLHWPGVKYSNWPRSRWLRILFRPLKHCYFAFAGASAGRVGSTRR